MIVMADGNRYLNDAIDSLGAAFSGNTLASCAQGLHFLVHAIHLGSLNSSLVSDASQLLFAVAPRVAEMTAGRIAAQEIYFCLGCANAALTTADAERLPWLLAAAAMLEADLRGVYLRNAIATGPQADLAFVIAKTTLSAVYDDRPAIH